jgi:hypothetical protein
VSDTKRPSTSRRNATTRVGYGVPHEAQPDNDETTSVDAAPVAKPPVAPAHVQSRSLTQPFPAVARPPIEVVLVDEDKPESANNRWRAVEIWTRNRIYALDATMTCFAVIDRATGRAEATHSFVGARLGGGQRREGGYLRIAHPFPVPGTEAVFKLPTGKRGPFGQTSVVERVVLRIRVTTAALLQAEPAWDEITGKYNAQS